ncbi:uncharacterized protein LOC144655712 isoform X3 [Oculina patagonica]
MKTIVILMLFSLACAFAGPYPQNIEIPTGDLCETCDGSCGEAICSLYPPCGEGFICKSCNCFCPKRTCVKH